MKTTTTCCGQPAQEESLAAPQITVARALSRENNFLLVEEWVPVGLGRSSQGELTKSKMPIENRMMSATP
jgi:hypothetical protein